jgi:hypothetical protein
MITDLKGYSPDISKTFKGGISKRPGRHFNRTDGKREKVKYLAIILREVE